MNIAALQAIAGKTASKSVQTRQASSETFGSVFGSLTAKDNVSVQQSANEVSDEKIQEIFKATSTEDLVALGLADDELAGLLDLDPKQLMDSIMSLLEKAGLGEEELAEVTYSNDIWAMLNAIDKVAPQFFQQLSEALVGNGNLPKQQAVDVLAMLKTVELVASKTDLLLKQEQQIFSLQGYLSAAGSQFEDTLNTSNSSKLNMLQLMESKSVARFVVQPNNGQAMTEDETTNKSSESSQQAVTSATGTVMVAKGEFTITEAENRNNARNEALMREMQNIFKRSNFGQTGGTNRLLVKLYPEHLGQVRIELLQVNGIMTARILASTALGKEMLDGQLNQLRQAFLQQNLQVERIDVAQTLQDTARNDREQAFNQHFKSDGQDAEHQQEQNEDEQVSFQEYMIELEV